MKWAAVPLAFTLISAFQDPIYGAVGLKAWVGEPWAVFFFLYGVAAPILVMGLIDGGFSRIVREIGIAMPPLPALVFGAATSGRPSLATRC
jgi:hypothetical protein